MDIPMGEVMRIVAVNTIRHELAVRECKVTCKT